MPVLRAIGLIAAGVALLALVLALLAGGFMIMRGTGA